MPTHHCHTLIIGAGIIGIAVAYYLKKYQPQLNIMLVDAGQPMALTSAQSGENYRNWWPHPVMTAFTDYSIDLMEAIVLESGNRIKMTRRGYVLTTRADDPVQLLNELQTGYGEAAEQLIRMHEQAGSDSYQPAVSTDWQCAPTGVDVLRNQHLIRHHFPYYDPTIKTLIHIRRAGDIDSQQLGQYMLEQFKQAGGTWLMGQVTAIVEHNGFQVQLDKTDDVICAEKIVNAAGPFINNIAAMLGTQLPVKNTLQQKIAFIDTAHTIPREMPFSIDLDGQRLDWTDEERELLAADTDYAWLTQEMPGAIHCRPDGGERGNRVKLGWAYNEAAAELSRNPELYTNFPEIVLRGAARLNPALKSYYKQLPRDLYHYGGYYTLTEENWPLIGAMAVENTYVAGAMSGFGTMAACSSGDICARRVSGLELPLFANRVSLQRYEDVRLMNELHTMSSRGIL